MSTITSANSTLYLGVANLFNVPVRIEGYATDDAFTAADVTTAETMMGVDGKLSAGFTPYPVPLEIALQADSASMAFFEAVITAEALAKEKYIMNGTILLPATGRLYTFTRGFLQKASPMPAAKKVLQPRKFEIVFQNMTAAPV
jgi:hypothetical protein